MLEFLFWFLLAGLLIASFQDFKRREVDYWLNYLLLAGSFAFVLFYSIFTSEYSIIMYSFLALGVFIILGNLFYYARVYGGGDSLLLIALSLFFIGAGFIETLQNQGIFMLLVFIAGSIWGLLFALFVFFRNFSVSSKHFKDQIKKGYFKLGILVGILLFVLSYVDMLFLFISILVFSITILWAFSKSVEDSSMTKSVVVSRLRQGDYLAKNIRFKGRTIKADWEGISMKDLNFLKSGKFKKKIEIRDGVPYVPAFLIAFILYWFFRPEILAWFARVF